MSKMCRVTFVKEHEARVTITPAMTRFWIKHLSYLEKSRDLTLGKGERIRWELMALNFYRACRTLMEEALLSEGPVTITEIQMGNIFLNTEMEPTNKVKRKRCRK